MSRSVNPRRAYDASGRQARARQSRLAVLAAARRRFLEEGYGATTMAGVAADAAVSVETVYKAFGSKAGLVKAVFDLDIAGDDEPVPVLEREFVRRNSAEPDPRRKLEAYGEHLASVIPRAGPIQLVVRAAAATDPAAEAVWQQLQQERLTGMTAFGAHLAADGHLRPGLTADDARDVLWVHSSVELWDLLVNERGWSAERYGRWIGQQLIAALL